MHEMLCNISGAVFALIQTFCVGCSRAYRHYEHKKHGHLLRLYCSMSCIVPQCLSLYFHAILTFVDTS